MVRTARSAQGEPGFPGGTCDRITCFRSAAFSGWCHQLAQDLGDDVPANLPQLGHRADQGATEWWRHGQAGQPALECLYSSTVRPFLGKRVSQQILSDPEGEPKREDSAALRTASGLRQQLQQGTRGWVPRAHDTISRNEPRTISGLISPRQR
jgi:hypothetical protein